MKSSNFPIVSPLQRPVPGKAGESPCAACKVRELAVCSVLDDAELDQLDAINTHVALTSGDTLFDEGEEAKYIYNVTEGALKLYKLLPDGRRQVTGFLFAGDFVGLADSAEYICSAESVGGVKLCQFPRGKLEAFIRTYPKMEARLLGMARNELAEAQEQMLLLGRKTAKERIASFLLMLSQRAQRRGQPGNPVDIPMNRNDIGDFLGLTTETVSRTLTRLKGSGIITTDADRRITITDVEALEDIAGGF